MIIPHFSATCLHVSIWSPDMILTYTCPVWFETSTFGSEWPNLINWIGISIPALTGSSNPNVEMYIKSYSMTSLNSSDS